MAREATRRSRDDEDEKPVRGRSRRDEDDDGEKPVRRGKADSKTGSGGASWNPDDAITTGLWQGGRATLNLNYETYGYPDKSGKDTVRPGVPVLMVTFETDAEKPFDEFSEPYTVGRDWKADDAYLIPKAGQTGLPTSCDAMQYFYKPLVEALNEADIPLPKDENGSCHVFNGIVVEVQRKPIADRGDFSGDRKRGERRSARDADDRDQRRKEPKTKLIITDVIEAPWSDNGASSGSKKRKAKADEEDEKPTRGRARRDDDEEDEKPTRGRARRDDDEEDEKPTRSARGKKDEPADDDLDELVVEALIELLEEEGESIGVDDLESKLMAALKGNKQRGAIAERAVEEDLLEQEQGWSYDAKKGTVSLAKRGRR